MDVSMYLNVLGRNGPYPEAGKACSSYLLESDSGNTRLLIDLGPGALSRLVSLCAPAELNGIILSHLHFDHMSDALVMKYYPDTKGIKLVCPQSPSNVLQLLSDHYDVYEPGDMKIGEMRLSFEKVKHPIETYALRVECDGSVFVYTGDSNECAQLSLFCDKADLLLADSGFTEEDWAAGKPHMSAARCAGLAKEALANQLVLTHINPKYDPEDLLNEALRIFPNTCLAEEGLRMRV